MSKQISAAELGEVVNKLLAGNSGELEHARNFQGFMTDLASLVAQFCGGEVHKPASRSAEDETWYVGIHGNDSLPEDGGIWAGYDPEGEMFEKIICAVKVTGDASDPDDTAIAGDYEFEVKLARAVDLDDSTLCEQSAIAKAGLDDFHNQFGIACLDDFNICVLLPNGHEIAEDENIEPGLVSAVAYIG